MARRSRCSFSGIVLGVWEQALDRFAIAPINPVKQAKNNRFFEVGHG
jgi:hypothetical protein